MLLTSSSGNTLGNLDFVWKVGSDDLIEQYFQTNQTVIEQTKPQFHTRTMRQALFSKYGRVSSGVKTAILHPFCKDLTRDCSPSHDTHEAEVDARVQEVLSMEPENSYTLIDLQEVKSKTRKTKFEVFWEEAKK